MPNYKLTLASLVNSDYLFAIQLISQVQWAHFTAQSSWMGWRGCLHSLTAQQTIACSARQQHLKYGWKDQFWWFKLAKLNWIVIQMHVWLYFDCLNQTLITADGLIPRSHYDSLYHYLKHSCTALFLLITLQLYVPCLVNNKVSWPVTEKLWQSFKACCWDMQQTDSRDQAKGLLKVMPSFVTVGEEKEYPQGLSSVWQARDDEGR